MSSANERPPVAAGPGGSPGPPGSPGTSRGAPRWALLAAVAGLLVVLIAAVIGLRPVAPSGAATGPAPSASPVPSLPAATTPAAGPTPVGPAATLNATGSPLVRVPSPARVVPVAESTDCQALVQAGWTGVCAPLQMAGGTVIWVVEHRPIPTSPFPAWGVTVFVYSASAGGWYPALAAGDPSGKRWTNVTATAVDLTGDGMPEILVGFRLQGSRSVLEYDIVGFPPSAAPAVLAHVGGLGRGAAVVVDGAVDDYAAEYPNGAPGCCPVDFLERAVRWTGAAFQATPIARVAPAAVPPSAI